MRILRIIASANPSHGGPIEGIMRVGEALRRRGMEQDLATLDEEGAPFLASMSARVFPLGDPPGKGAIPARVQSRLHYAPRAVPWLKANTPGYDVVIVSGLWHYATLAARRALVGGPTPYVVFTHGMLDPWFNTAYPRKAMVKRLLWRVNEGVLLRNAAAVLFTSDEERLRARESFRPYDVREQVVSYGTADPGGDPLEQTRLFRACLPALGDRRFLLFLSRIHEKKGCDLLLEAFAAVASGTPDLDLVIAGPDQVGLRAQLEARARALGIEKRVHWPGMLKGDLKWGAFRDSDAFVLPSHQENFGIVVAEALAVGKPVLISDKVNIWREVEEDDVGFVEPDTLEGTTALLRRFLSLGEDDRRAMNVRARSTFLRRFEIGSAADDLAGLLSRVGRPARSA